MIMKRKKKTAKKAGGQGTGDGGPGLLVAWCFWRSQEGQTRKGSETGKNPYRRQVSEEE
jgi:hypothetical protein